MAYIFNWVESVQICSMGVIFCEFVIGPIKKKLADNIIGVFLEFV